LAGVPDLPAALAQMLDDPGFTEGARAVAAEIAGLPAITECPPILEQLANEPSVSRS
jgi:hypothetical protein